VSPDQEATAGDRPERDAGTWTTTLRAGGQFGKQLPIDILPPEAVERLRAGGTLTPQELALVHAAATAPGSIAGVLPDVLDRIAAPAEVQRSDVAVPGDIPGSAHSWTWTWRPGGAAHGAATGQRPGAPAPGMLARDHVAEPATYYEALSGQRDPHRDVFIAVRRILNLVTWAIALGLPVVLVAIAVLTGQSFETIVFTGIGATVVGLMFKHSFPRTPFG
jgi:hypothetical protein